MDLEENDAIFSLPFIMQNAVCLIDGGKAVSGFQNLHHVEWGVNRNLRQVCDTNIEGDLQSLGIMLPMFYLPRLETLRAILHSTKPGVLTWPCQQPNASNLTSMELYRSEIEWASLVSILKITPNLNNLSYDMTLQLPDYFESSVIDFRELTATLLPVASSLRKLHLFIELHHPCITDFDEDNVMKHV